MLDNCEYDSSNTIHLKKDAAVSSRYWCLHNTGVHSVTMPLTELLDEFSKSVKSIYIFTYIQPPTSPLYFLVVTNCILSYKPRQSNFPFGISFLNLKCNPVASDSPFLQTTILDWMKTAYSFTKYVKNTKF